MTTNYNKLPSILILLWNTNEIKQHSYELFYLMHNKNINILLITKTHLSKNTNINFNGYSIIRVDGTSRV